MGAGVCGDRRAHGAWVGVRTDMARGASRGRLGSVGLGLGEAQTGTSWGRGPDSSARGRAG